MTPESPLTRSEGFRYNRKPTFNTTPKVLITLATTLFEAIHARNVRQSHAFRGQNTIATCQGSWFRADSFPLGWDAGRGGREGRSKEVH